MQTSSVDIDNGKTDSFSSLKETDDIDGIECRNQHGMPELEKSFQ